MKMNRCVALLVLAVSVLLLPTLVVVVWRATRLPPAAPARSPEVVLPAQLLPRIVLPGGSDPQSMALRRSIRRGEQIYQRLCYHCHGRLGKGDANPYMARIGHKPADHSDAAKMQKLSDWEFFVALRDGVKDERGWFTMPPWESVLTAAEMWDVIAYVRRLPGATAGHP